MSNDNGEVRDKLERLVIGTVVDVSLSRGDIIKNVTFLKYDKISCWVFFRDNKTKSNTLIIIDCHRINTLRISVV